MITEDTFILDYLERNFIVSTSEYHYYVTEAIPQLELNKTYTFATFQQYYEKLFTKSTMYVFNTWFEQKTSALVKELEDYVDTLENTDGGLAMLDKIITRFKNPNGVIKYHDSFIMNFFDKYYRKKWLIPMLNELKETFLSSHGKSASMLAIVDNKLEFDTERHRDYAFSYINEWYSDEILGQQITALFREFVVTLGERNWKITWVGHGPVTKEIIEAHFKDETDFQKKLVMMKFNQWYELAIIEASERQIKHNFNTGLFGY